MNEPIQPVCARRTPAGNGEKSSKPSVVELGSAFNPRLRRRR
jgi:hypothetical protein